MNKTTSLILLLLALLVWLIFGSWLYRRSCCDGAAAATTGAAAVGGGTYCGQWRVFDDETDFDHSAKRYLRFLRNESIPNNYEGTDIDELLSKVSEYQANQSDRNLIVTGLYDEDESYEGSYDNLGIERAEVIKEILINRGANGEMVRVESAELEEGGFDADTICHGIEMFFTDGSTSEVIEEDSGAAAAVTAESVCSDLDTEGLTLYFDFSSAKNDFTDGDREYLDALVSCLNSRSDATISIEGHTDNVGGSANNQVLSEARARKVRNYLTAAGIDKSRLNKEGFGDTKPIESNDTEEGRAKNRRVEVRLN